MNEAPGHFYCSMDTAYVKTKKNRPSSVVLGGLVASGYNLYKYSIKKTPQCGGGVFRSDERPKTQSLKGLMSSALIIPD